MLQMETTRHYFVGHHYHQRHVNDFRFCVESVLEPKGYKPYYADSPVASPLLLLKLCEKIYATDFGIFDLAVENPNVYIELGIAMGFNKRFLIIAPQEVESHLPSSLKGHPIVYYDGYVDLTYKLDATVDVLFKEMLGPVDYCYYCGKTCEGLTVYPDRNTYLILDKASLLNFGVWKDLKSVIEPAFEKSNLHAVSLRDADGAPWLCSIRKKVRSTQFSVCHLGKLSNPDTFIALGMAIASCRPWLLITREEDDPGEDFVLADSQGLDCLHYSSLADLGDKLESSIGDFLELFYEKPSSAETSSLTKKPFWILLLDYLETVRPALKATASLKGNMRIVQVGNQGFLDKFMITRKGLVLGRDLTCDIVINHSMASGKHARVFEQDGAYYLQDLKSKNGTFVNGIQLLPNEVVRINRGDKIRLAYAERYLVWDDRPLPTEPYEDSVPKTSVVAPAVEIILFAGQKSPGDGKGKDDVFYLDVHGEASNVYKIRSSYRLGKVLEEIAKLNKFPLDQYCFVRRNQVIDERKTPLELELRDHDSVEIVDYKSLVKTVFSQNYSLFDDKSNQKHVDFMFMPTDGKDDHIIFVCASKYEIRVNDINALIDDANSYRRLSILSSRVQLLDEISDIEKEMQVVQEKKRLRQETQDADKKLHWLDAIRAEKRKGLELFDHL